MNILLIGNPNVGKSAIFAHLTGVNVTASNYPGTTVNFLKGNMRFQGKAYEIIDVPGTYRLDPDSEAEKVAVKMIQNCDMLINVVDATNLERNLNLTLQLMEFGKPMVVALNMWDDCKHKGILIDIKKLKDLLGIPIIATNGLTGEGLAKLQEACLSAQPVVKPGYTNEKRWEAIGKIVMQVQDLSNRQHTLIERLQDLMIHPVFGLPIAGVILYFTFKLVIFSGEFLIDIILKLFNVVYLPFILWLSQRLGGEGILHALFIGDIAGNTVDFEAAMGVLTTGVYVVFGVVLPYILVFYIIFGFLEDLGYLPRVSIVFDRLLHHIGLHGYSLIPMLLACGCNVPGVLAIRNLDTRRERFITAVVSCVSIPCMAQTALIVRSVGSRGGLYLAVTFMSLFTVWVILGMILKRTVRGTTPTLLMEVPPYRFPGLANQCKKIRMRIVCFLKEAIPFVFGGIFVVNTLQITGIINFIGNLFAPIIRGVFGLPTKTVSAIIIGLLRKDVAVALLEPMGLSNSQIVTAVLVLVLFFPCIATFVVLLKELGIKDTLKAVLIMFTVTLITGGTLNLLLDRVFSAGIMIIFELLLIGGATCLTIKIPRKTKKINFNL